MNDISKINAILKQLTEGQLGDMALKAEQDHEVQMARADLYKLAKYAIKLHEMLKNVSEAQGLEGWQQAKITKAADYISSVYHNLEYEMSGMDVGSDIQTVEINPEFEDVKVTEGVKKKTNEGYRVSATDAASDDAFKSKVFKDKAAAEAEAKKMKSARDKRGGKQFHKVMVVSESRFSHWGKK